MFSPLVCVCLFVYFVFCSWNFLCLLFSHRFAFWSWMAWSLLRWAENRLRSTNIIKSFYWKYHNNRHSLHNYTHTHKIKTIPTLDGKQAKKNRKREKNLSSHTFLFKANKINKLFFEKYSASNWIIHIFLVLKLVGIF